MRWKRRRIVKRRKACAKQLREKRCLACHQRTHQILDWHMVMCPNQHVTGMVDIYKAAMKRRG